MTLSPNFHACSLQQFMVDNQSVRIIRLQPAPLNNRKSDHIRCGRYSCEGEANAICPVGIYSCGQNLLPALNFRYARHIKDCFFHIFHGVGLAEFHFNVIMAGIHCHIDSVWPRLTDINCAHERGASYGQDTDRKQQSCPLTESITQREQERATRSTHTGNKHVNTVRTELVFINAVITDSLLDSNPAASVYRNGGSKQRHRQPYKNLDCIYPVRDEVACDVKVQYFRCEYRECPACPHASRNTDNKPSNAKKKHRAEIKSS